MPTLVEKARLGLANVLLGEEKQRLERTTRLLYEAYLDGPFVQSPEELIAQLSEQRSAVLYDLLLQLGWEYYGLGYRTDEQERDRAVDESRRLWKYSVVGQWQIWLWTNFGFGENIIVTPLDQALLGEVDEEGNPIPLARQIWHEFRYADRNHQVMAEDRIHELSNWLLVDGEHFLAFYASDVDGEARIRRLDPKEIVEIVTDPNDASTPLFYKRQFTDANETTQTWYYPDWRLFFSDDLEEKAKEALPKDAVRADRTNSDGDEELGGKQKAGTVVCILHIAYNCKELGDLHGWPLLAPAGAPWLRAHKKFREDRAAVAATVAMFVEKIKHEGGSRAGAGLRSQLQSALTSTNYTETNPPPVAGSRWIGNKAIDLERLPMSTGAGDAKADGEAMLLMAGLAGGVFPHYLGAGDAYRLATATSMERPLLMQWSRYQLFWSAQFRKMVRIVLQYREKYNNVTFETYDAEVSTDRLVEADLDVVTSAAARFYRDVLMPQIEMKTLDAEVARKLTARVTRVVLQALGVADADEVASDEAFGVGIEGEEVPEEWAAELARSVAERYAAGESPAEAVADWALATLMELDSIR